MGGELPLNACYIFEASPTAHRSVLCSIAGVSAMLGQLLASLTAFLLFRYFNQEIILSWAWRIPFLLSIPLTISIGYIRRVINHSPIYQQSDSPLHALKQPLFNMGLFVSFFGVTGYILILWIPSYLMHFSHYPAYLAQSINVLFLVALAFFTLAAGYIAHFVGYQRLIQTSLIALLLLIYPLFKGLQEAPYGLVLAILLILALLHGSINGVIMQALASQFPTFVRCRGMNLAYTLPMVIFGGTAPLICTWMINKTGLLLFPAFYILFFGLLALPAAWRLKADQVPAEAVSARP